ncbi:zinc-finger associated domain containing protein, partial [Oryctes borbonicus]
MKICRDCVKHLRICYKFLKMVQSSQESLRQLLKQETILIKAEETNSDDEGTNENIEVNEDLYVIESDSCSSELELKRESPNIITFTCSKCNKNNMPPEEYLDHVCEIKTRYSIKMEDAINEAAINCSAHSNEKKEITKKVKTKSYSCEHCDYNSEKRWQLTKHMQKVHNKDKMYLCTFCNKAFKQAYHLREHITTHTGERNFSCPICDKTFVRSSSQRRHIKSHEAAPGQKTKRTPFLCTICGKSFPFSNGVQRHMRVHLGIRKYECHICKRRFMQSTHLSVHMRIHTGEKPYICDICGEAFSLNCSLQKHMKVHRGTDEKD